MNELTMPWIEVAMLSPLAGGVIASRLRDFDTARKWATAFSAVSLTAVLWDWIGFAHGRAVPSVIGSWCGRTVFAMDELNAPPQALTALLFLLTFIATPRPKIGRFSFAWSLASKSIVLATLACVEPWVIVLLMSLGTLPAYLDLRARQRPSRVFAVHMAVFVALLVIGWGIVEYEGVGSEHSWLALVPLLAAICIRAGLFPGHCWVADLFEHAAFGTALLFVLPMTGIYSAARLLFPIAPAGILRSLGMMALITSLYASGMALVQRESRRFYCYLFLSHKSLVMVGMDTIAPVGLTGGLCVWLSVGLGLGGLGLTLRALEARHGRLSLTAFHGLGEYTPMLAVFFLLTGLASIGFPGTFGFIGSDMLVDGAANVYPYVGIAVVIVAALNGIAVVRAYFLLFTGTRHVSSVPLAISVRERVVVLTIAFLILGGGLFPQPGVVSRHLAAEEMLRQRGEKSAWRIGDEIEAGGVAESRQQSVANEGG